MVVFDLVEAIFVNQVLRAGRQVHEKLFVVDDFYPTAQHLNSEEKNVPINKI